MSAESVPKLIARANIPAITQLKKNAHQNLPRLIRPLKPNSRFTIPILEHAAKQLASDILLPGVEIAHYAFGGGNYDNAEAVINLGEFAY